MQKNKYHQSIRTSFDNFPYKDQISYSEFVKICKTFNALLVRHSLNDGRVTKLPHRTGLMFVGKAKVPRNRRRFNVIHYNLTGEKTFFTNKHSEGYYASFRWRKTDRFNTTPNKSAIQFKTTQSNRKLLYKTIVNKNTIHKYYDLR